MEKFKFNGRSSDVMGVLMTEEWQETKPEEDYEQISIEGKDGSIYTPLNYRDIQKNVQCVLLNKDRQQDVMQWLNGKGIFELNGRYKQAYIFQEITFEKRGPFKKQFEIPFILEPFWYKNDAYTEYTESVMNEGNIEAVPMIKLTGTGTVDLTVNDVRFAVTFDDSGSIEIDCKEKVEDKPKCISIGFEYPTLKPGKNAITFHTGTCRVYMKRKDRWLG